MTESHDTVWLISYSVEANDEIVDELDTPDYHSGRQLVFERSALGSDDPRMSNVGTVPADLTLCGAILVLETGAWDNEDYRHWVRWCIRQATIRDDFRLWVCLYGLSRSEFDRQADLGLGSDSASRGAEGNRLLYELRDNIQMAPSDDRSWLKSALHRYSQQLDNIRDTSRWRSLRVALSITTGWAATVIQVACAASLALGTLFFTLARRQAMEFLLPSWGRIALAVVPGIAFFPLVTVPLSFLGRGIGESLRLRDDRRYILWLAAFALLGPATIGLPQQMKAPMSWFLVGIAAGVLIDLARRGGLQARRIRIAVNPQTDPEHPQGLSTRLRDVARGRVPDPLTCPLMPVDAARVFISYTHSSVWARELVASLHGELRAFRVECFLDERDIPHGHSWRRLLHRKVANATVFISVVDGISVGKQWPAAELEAALESRRLTGIPDVILLRQSESPSSVSGLPVFTAVLAQPGDTRPGRPRIVTVTHSTVSTLAASLRQYRSPSVLSPAASTIPFAFALLPGAVGPLGTVVGWIALLLFLLQRAGKLAVSTFIYNHGLLAPAFLLCGLWLGFTSRLTAASRYEVRTDSPRLQAITNLVACAGFLILLRQWLAQVSPLVVGWTLVLCGIGWLSGSSFVYRVSRRKPDLSRETD